MSMSNGVTGGIFASQADMIKAPARVGTRLELNTGERFAVEVADGGSGILLNNGLYANPISDPLLASLAFNDEIPNEQPGTSYQLLISDRGKTIKMNNAAANTVTAPLDSTEAITTNSTSIIIQTGAGATTLQAETGVTINGVLDGSVTLSGPYNGGSLTKVGINEYEWLGDGDISQGGGVDITKLFKTTLYTGNGSTQSINTGLDMIANDGLVWIKNRDAVINHQLTDTKRGNGVYIKSNAADPNAATGLFDFDSDGFIVNNHPLLGELGDEVVAWNFVKSPKFLDIITYTGDEVAGREIPHSLGVQPGLVLIKDLGQSNNWSVQSINIPATEYLALNLTDRSKTDNDIWNSTHADENNLTLGTSFRANQAGRDFIAYLFAHDPDGVIQCGEYTGNGAVSGPIIDLGWQPQFLLIKSTNGIGNWVMLDTERGITAGNEQILYSNLTGSEQSIELLDLTATGFQPTSQASNEVNQSGINYIYMAIRKPE